MGLDENHKDYQVNDLKIYLTQNTLSEMTMVGSLIL